MMSPTEILGSIFAVIYALTMTLLALQGAHLLWMLGRWWRHRGGALRQEAAENDSTAPADETLPRVLVQLPVFNERDMVERLVETVAQLDWPKDRLAIQLLDDSTDDSTEIGKAAIARLQDQGFAASYLHRVDRVGFKAGALDAGMKADDAPFIAIFDADFVPDPSFLKRAMIPLLQEEDLALVQGRWEHLNRQDKAITAAQAVGIDAHFAIEQSARAWSGLAMNFNGTCGVWRRSAIIAGGGWEHDTLTEDMDLSYRVQLAGWRCTYRVGLAVPGELPPTLPAFMQQQFRWAKGSIQTAKKLLGPIWKSTWGLHRKTAATMHLCHYMVHPLMLIAMISAPPALWLTPALPVWMWWFGAIIFCLGAGAPLLTYAVGQFALGRGGWHLFRDIPRLAALGTGIAINNTRACIEALRGKESDFERTPKGKSAVGTYRIKRKHGGWELLAGCWAASGIIIGAIIDRSWIAPVLLIYASGLLSVGGSLLWGRWKEYKAQRPKAHNPRLVRRWFVLAGIAALSLGGYTALALHPETWRQDPIFFGGIGLGLGALWLIAVACIAHWKRSVGALPLIIATAVIMRLLSFAIAPSDDVNRYLVEGAQIEAWQNPYTHAPSEPSTISIAHGAGISQTVLNEVNHPTVTASYPPFTLFMHALVLRIAPEPWAMQLAAFVAEGIALILVLLLLARLGMRRDWLLIAAWCPLAPLFAVGEAHDDAIMMPLVVGAILLAVIAKERRSLLAMGSAALVKPFAAWLLLPLLWGQSWKRWVAMIGLAVLAYLPFSGAGWGMFATFASFGTELSFNAVLEPIIRYLYSLMVPEHFVRPLTVLSLVTLLIGASIWLLRRYAQAGNLRDPRLLASLATLLLLCLPTLHIWYLLLALPLAPFIRSWGLLLWLALTPAYWLHGIAIQANGGVWTEDNLVRSLMHLPPLLLLIWESLGKPGLPPPSKPQKIPRQLVGMEQTS